MTKEILDHLLQSVNPNQLVTVPMRSCHLWSAKWIVVQRWVLAVRARRPVYFSNKFTTFLSGLAHPYVFKTRGLWFFEERPPWLVLLWASSLNCRNLTPFSSSWTDNWGWKFGHLSLLCSPPPQSEIETNQVKDSVTQLVWGRRSQDRLRPQNFFSLKPDCIRAALLSQPCSTSLLH